MPVLLECLYCEMSWPIVGGSVRVGGAGWDRALLEGLCALAPQTFSWFLFPPPSASFLPSTVS